MTKPHYEVVEKTKGKKYVIDNTELMREWDYQKNNLLDLYPDQLSYGSGTKVWWICVNGHEWEATPNHRSKGSGCPICAKEIRAKSHSNNWLVQKGSLATNNPLLAKEWHPTKNGDLKPSDITTNNGKKVWWMCSKGHEWEAVVKSRNHGVGCPICSGHQVLVGYNDLASVNPQLASEWHPTKNGDLKPTDVTISNGKKVWWMCSKGHEWEAKIANRTIGDGCPICSGHKVLIGYNDLATTNPQIANEWHPTKNGELKPTDVTSGSNRKVWWICKKSHEWNDTISHRNGGRGCPICAGEMKTSFPEQAIFYYLNKITTTYNRYKIDRYTEIDIFLPEYNIGIEYDGIYYHTGKRAEEREKRKEETLYKLGIELIRIKEDINDNRFDNIIFSKPGIKDEELRKLIFQILKRINNSEENKILNIDIDIKRDRTEIYNQYIELEKNNSLKVINPTLANEWHPTKNGKLSPDYVTVNSNKKIWWLCKNGHEWEAIVSSRNNGVGCPICSGHKVLIGYNDLATTNPQIANEWHLTKNGGLKPTDVTKNSNKKVWWICNKGHEWEATISHRNTKRGCPYCGNRKVLSGYNDLSTINPMLASEWHPTKNGSLMPRNITVGSSKKVWWMCKEGHEWEAQVYSRNHGYGCPYCAGQKVIKGVNDLKNTNPKLAEEWHPIKNGDLTPSDVMVGSTKKVWWLCKEGHEWEAYIYSRNSGSGCPICYKIKRNIKIDK